MKKSLIFLAVLSFIFLLSATITLSQTSPTYTNTTLESNNLTHLNTTSDINLIGYWPMDSNISQTTIYDYTNSSNDGTLSGDAIFNATGVYGGAYSFDGTSDQINFGNNYNFERNDSFSFALWFNTNATESQVLVSKRGSSSGDEGYDVRIKSSSKIQILLAGGSTNRIDVQSNNVFGDGAWHHLVVTYNGSSNWTGIKAYIDDVAQTMEMTRDELSDTMINSRDFKMGAIGTSSRPYTGSLDDVMVFDKELTSAEASDIYNTKFTRFHGTGDLLFQNLDFGGNETINITLQNCNNLSGSSLRARINTGVWSDFVSCAINGYHAVGDLNNANLTIGFEAGNLTDPFYSPAIFGNITLESTRARKNVSIQHFFLNIDDVILDSEDYVVILNTSMNVSQPTNVHFRVGGQLSKTSVDVPTNVSMRFTLNGVVLKDEKVRTLSNLNDIGVFTFPAFEDVFNSGENIFLAELKEDGSGGTNLSKFGVHIITNTTGLFDEIRGTIVTENVSFSSTTTINIVNFTINKAFNSTTLVDINHKFESTSGAGATMPSCFLRNVVTGERTPTYTRYLSSTGDIGSSGINFRSSLTQSGEEIWALYCGSDDTDMIANNVTGFLIELTDTNQDTIQGFRNESLQIQTITGTSNLIASFNNYTIRNGTSIEVITTVIAQSTSGAQNGANSPRFILNRTGTSTSCNENRQRSLSDNNDIGTIKFYTHCDSFTVGDELNFNVFADVVAGETLNILNVSISSFEVVDLNVSDKIVAPIVDITIPVDGVTISGNQDINITVTDLSATGWRSNVSLLNPNSSFVVTILSEGITTDLNTTGVIFDTTSVSNGNYTIHWNVTNSAGTNTDEAINISINNVVAPPGPSPPDGGGDGGGESPISGIEVFNVSVFAEQEIFYYDFENQFFIEVKNITGDFIEPDDVNVTLVNDIPIEMEIIREGIGKYRADTLIIDQVDERLLFRVTAVRGTRQVTEQFEMNIERISQAVLSRKNLERTVFRFGAFFKNNFEFLVISLISLILIILIFKSAKRKKKVDL